MQNVPLSVAPLATIDVAENRKNKFQGLDEVRQAFCIAYVQNGYRHRDAAVAVGLMPDVGIGMKREPVCAAFIVDLQKKYLAESSVTKEMLDIKLDTLEDMAMGDIEVPMVSAMGAQIHLKKFHPELAMKVFQERAKLHNFADEENKVAPVNVTINVAALLGTPPDPSNYDNKGIVIEQ